MSYRPCARNYCKCSCKAAAGCRDQTLRARASSADAVAGGGHGAGMSGEHVAATGSQKGGTAVHVVSGETKTLSVVLPCAFEYGLMQNTAASVFEATPPEVLHEIVTGRWVNPPLRPLFEDSTSTRSRGSGTTTKGAHRRQKDRRRRCNWGHHRVLRLSCQARSCWKPMVAQMQENYKRVVVPTITNLNVDTWTEFGRPAAGQGMSKCYLTFDAEFKWTTDSTPYVPVMSGGLLAMSRRWWHETGGYDEHMIGWGGRIWTRACGSGCAGRDCERADIIRRAHVA